MSDEKNEKSGMTKEEVQNATMATYARASMSGGVIGLIPVGIQVLDMLVTNPMFGKMFEDEEDRRKLREALEVLSVTGDKVISLERDFVLAGIRAGREQAILTEILECEHGEEYEAEDQEEGE